MGRLAIHYVAFSECQRLDVMDCLLTVFPQGAKEADVYGRLPLHYAVDHSDCSIEAVICLLKAYPEAASTPDKAMKYPLTIALERGHSIDIIRLLFEAFPEINFDTSNGKRSLLHLYLERIPFPQLDIVRYIIKVDSMTRKKSEKLAAFDTEQVLILCRSRQLEAIEREVLLNFLHSEDDMLRLKQLNWQARKPALIIVKAVRHCLEEHIKRPQSGNIRADILYRLNIECKQAFERAVSFL